MMNKGGGVLQSGATSAWRDWYRCCHEDRFAQSQGTAFEKYVTDALDVVHGGDFINPLPKGQLGDYGCDGITGDGEVAYACFGYLPNRASEKDLAAKVTSDFIRAKTKWATFTNWRFVSNVGIGPLAAQALISINQEHKPGSDRVVKASSFDRSKFWNELLLPLNVADLDKLFPGVPHAQNVQLRDLVPLLDALDQTTLGEIEDVPAGAVSPKKMEFNSLSRRVQMEFGSARVHMPAIHQWFAGHSDPTLRDAQGQKFREIYLDARKSATNSNEVIERLYVSLGGQNFRLDDRLANAVYAVTAFFFDECDIFELPPENWEVKAE
jgi:hypothetical protein